MDLRDTLSSLITIVGRFVEGRLIDKEQRIQHKEQCAERLAAEDGSIDQDTEVRYSDQAVLANLDWGIEALEEAISTSNMETKLARLDYAEKMLQVCAMLNSGQRTAGVPNFYLSAWAHLNLSYLWRLRNNVRNSTLHVLEMFIIDPFFSRVDFALELWKELFLPHMRSIVGWYSEARQGLMIEVIPDSSDFSFTADLDQFFNESLMFSMRPDQVEKLQKLEQLYGETLNENTQIFAKHFRDCMNSDATTVKKMIPMLPIAEPPMTPLHEVSLTIPDYVKFGPVLPKSSGFSPVLRSTHGAREPSRLSVSSTLSHRLDKSATWDPQDPTLEESGDESDCELDRAYLDSNDKSRKLLDVSNTKVVESKEIGSSIHPQERGRVHSPTLSPMDSSRTSSPNISAPKLDAHSRKEPASMLRHHFSRVMDSTNTASLPSSPLMHNDYIVSSPNSHSGGIDMERSVGKNYDQRRNKSYDVVNCRASENSYLYESDEGSQSSISISMSEKSISRRRPPKDFICPITGQLFNDPVTLETGQTYEREAIQEWLGRGNTTCPITRQPLSSNFLPKTNFVLKKLITSWKEQYPDLSQEYSISETPLSSFIPSPVNDYSLASTPSRIFDFPIHKSTENQMHLRGNRFVQAASSPTSVICQATKETIISGLKPYTSCLCSSDNLQECESAVLAVAKLWKESKGDPVVHSYLSKPTIINGFMEILSASLNREVLSTSIYILSLLTYRDERVGGVLTSVDSDFDCLAGLLKNGLAEAAVLIFLLRPAFSQLAAHSFIPTLVQLIQNKNDDLDGLQWVMDPKDAAIAMLEQLLTGGDENSRSVNAFIVISANAIPALVVCLGKVEGKKSVISILLCCMHADRSCRNLIASTIELCPVIELFHAGTDSVRGLCVYFLTALVQLNRRIFCNQILEIIRDEGAFSTMHSFLVYLQMAPMEQQPAISTLLLQLDLLDEPRKMSIYREEALEALIESLQRKDFPNSQMMALDALACLSGRLTSSGRSYAEAWLLKIAGFDKPYNTLMKSEQLSKHENALAETLEDEEKATISWETRMAFVLCNHERGSIFKALEECFKSNSLEMAKSCLVISTWLIYMLSILPDTGVRDAARKSLLEEVINVLQSSRNLEEKLLATLAIKTFVSEPELAKYAKCIYTNLRKIKRHSTIVADVLKSLMNLSSVNATELWNCTQVVELESSGNGEVLSLLHLKGRVLSGHSDGTIKMWDSRKKALRLIQEVREHTKAVTCLQSSGDRLYTGSLDKTIRVWAIKHEEIHCLQVHDVKEAMYELTANATVACFVPQGTGVKVYNWSGVPKQINFNKNVKCLAMTGDKLYCGCSGYSIQEVDLCKLTSTTFYTGTRKLLGKQSIQFLHIQDSLLCAGGSAVDGMAGKVFSHSTKAVVGSFSTGFDITHIVANNDFIFTATKCGVIEVWLKEKITRVAFIKATMGGHAKITSLASDMDGGMLYAGSSDGKIQAWALD